MFSFYDALTARLRAAGEWVWPTGLRLILAWEFWESGITKYRGQNWFDTIPWAEWQKGFPLPFSLLPGELNWQLATWGELVCAGLLLSGLFTRFTALALIVITAVATAAVHWPANWESLQDLWSGYVITAKGAGNFKLPLLFIIMLLPLVFHGGGRLSLDYLMLSATRRAGLTVETLGDWQAAGLALWVLGLAVIWLEPIWGFTLLGAGVVALCIPQFIGNPLRPDF